MKFASCLAVLFFFLPTAVSQKPDVAKPGLHDILIKTAHDTASYFGFGVKCQNQGHKTEENTCICPKYFKGKECETKICINGGKLEKVAVPTVHQICKCPNPAHIAGEHCEKIRCDNRGVLQSYTNGTWKCNCQLSRFYGGTFCERFILSTGWIMGVICIGVLLIVACICSSNWFTRKDRAREQMARCEERARNRAGRQQIAARARAAGHRSSSADDLVSSERGVHRRTAAYPETLMQQHFVRLDTIPTFNPSMIGGVEPQLVNREQQPVGPPPSYDQAMSSLRVEPPEYTPTDAAKLNA